MDISTLLEALHDPRVYPHPASDIRVVHTHASAVVLAGEHVYKLKKPVDFGFLDYSTLEKRRAMCTAEVELNRRLAPGVYLGVVPITCARGRIVLGGDGDVIEYAVHMRRLPEEATLATRVLQGPLDGALAERIGRMLADFHRQARRGQDVSHWAGFERVRENCRENFAGLATQADVVAPRAELMRLELATEAELTEQHERIERRAALDVPCETHGDLRLEHVYLLPGDELCIVDCIEFSERFRCADPVLDMAFLAMDLQAHGAWSAARALIDSYFESSGDQDGRELVPLFLAYRSTVRAKVRAMQAASPGIPAEQRTRSLQLARAHIQLAIAELSPADERPCLVLVGGLPGTGKSVLSDGLVRTGHFHWLRADAIRKELAGIDPLASGASDVRTGIYTPAWNDRTYDECLTRARELLFRGGRVLIDASFKEERRRLAFVDAARDWGVPVRILETVSPAALVRTRLARRTQDPSDADWTIYEHVRATWEPFGPRTAELHDTIDTSGSPEQSIANARAALVECGLANVR